MTSDPMLSYAIKKNMHQLFHKLDLETVREEVVQ